MSDSATPLYVFIDESGNFDFSASGTNHFVMAAVIARDPLTSANALQNVKYELMAAGTDEPFFHASEDKQAVRDQVFEAIDGLQSISSHVVYVDKHRAAPALQNTVRMYSLFGGCHCQIPLDGAAKREVQPDHHRVRQGATQERRERIPRKSEACAQ